MLDVIYLFLIFIVGSISIQISSGIFIMPYLLYLSNNNNLSSFILVVLTSVIYSLQTDKILEILFFFIAFYLLFMQLSKHLHYTYMNILFLSILEQTMWVLIFEKKMDNMNLFISFIFYNIFNLIFIKIYKKSKAGVVR